MNRNPLLKALVHGSTVPVWTRGSAPSSEPDPPPASRRPTEPRPPLVEPIPPTKR